MSRKYPRVTGLVTRRQPARQTESSINLRRSFNVGVLLVTAMLFIVAASVEAQTEIKDRGTSMARNDQLNPALAYPTQTATSITVWEDNRDDQNGTDIYISAVDNTLGTNVWIADGFPPDVVTDRYDGIPVCTAPEDQRNPRAGYDGLGGVIVVWQDYRNDPTLTVADIYAQRFIVATGRPDPNWPVNGIAVCQTGFHCERPRIVGTVDGAFITWIDYRNDPGTPPFDRDVFVQYIQSATASWPPAPTNWVQNGIPVPTNPDPDQINPELDIDNIFALDMLGNLTQGVVVTYQDDRYIGNYSGQPVWTVFANRIDANGVQMYTTGPPPWSADVPAAPSYENQEYPRIVTTGKLPYVTNQMAVLVWQDMIDNPASGSTDIFAQELDAVGTPQFPGPNGLAVCQVPLRQTLPQPTLWESGSPLIGTYIPLVTVGWLDERDYPQNGVDIYAGLIDARAPGMLMNPQGPAGDPVCTLPEDQTQLSMDNLHAGSMSYEITVFAWAHETSTGSDIWTQEIGLLPWTLVWPMDGWPVTEAKGNQILPQVNREVFFWQDGRRDPIANDYQDDENIMCQTPGPCTGGTEMKLRDVFAKWSPGEDAEHFRFVVDPADGSTFIVWDEVRYPYAPNDPYRIVFIQKLDKDGVPRWATNGVAVSLYACGVDGCTQNASIPDVCIDGAGGARVVWQQTEGIYSACRASHVPANGVPVFHISHWADNFLGGTDNFTEPRIVNISGANNYAGIGVLVQTSVPNQTIPAQARWDAKGVARLAPVPGLLFFDHTDLRIAYDGNSRQEGIYCLTRSLASGKLSILHRDLVLSTPTFATTQFAWNAFGGYDLTSGTLSPPTLRPAFFTWSQQANGGVPFEIHIGYFHPAGGFATTRITNHTILATPPKRPDSKSPVLVGDSLTANYHEGLLLAWDTEVYTLSGSSTHRVETDRWLINWINPPTINASSVFASTFIIGTALSVNSHPDIARVVNPMPNVGPFGVVVWEGGGETSPCTPARPMDVMGQYMLYDPAALNAGPQWAGAQMIAPGPGNYFQRGPQVESSLPGAVSVFWYDGQTGDISLIGTRLPDLHDAIYWAKAARREEENSLTTPSFRIESIWPQPAEAGTDAVNFRIASDADATLTAEVFDLLGRRRAVLHDGAIEQHGLILSISPSAVGLQTGTYLIRLRGSHSTLTRKFTIIR